MFHEGALPSSWHDIYCLCWWEGARTGGQRWGEGWLEVKRDISAMSRGEKKKKTGRGGEQRQMKRKRNRVESLSAITPSVATAACVCEFTSGLYCNFAIWISTNTSQRAAMSALCQSWWSHCVQCLKVTLQPKKTIQEKRFKSNLIFGNDANICSSLMQHRENSPAARRKETVCFYTNSCKKVTHTLAFSK